MTVTVNLVTYSDADFTLSHESEIAVGSNVLRMHVRKTADDNTVWLEATTTNGMLVVETDEEEVETIVLTIPEANLLSLPAGEYVQSLIMSSVSVLGVYSRTEIWRGTLTHNVGPTRWEAGTL
jgi:hypothetical protein